MYHQEFALSIFSDAEVVKLSVGVCWNNYRWTGDGYECGWIFHSGWIPSVTADIWSVQLGPDHDVLWSSRFAPQPSLILSVLMCCGCGDFHVLIWCCLSICAFQEVAALVLAGSPQESRFTSVLVVLTRVSPKRLLAGLPSAVPDDWPGGGIICFPQSGGWVRLLLRFTFLFFCAPSGTLLSQISALQTHRLSSVGRKKGRAGCLNCNCNQDWFAGFLGNESKEAGSSTFSFPVFW